MIISVAALTLRFYTRDGWTKQKVRKLLVKPHMGIIYRNEQTKFQRKYMGDMRYYAVYEKSGHKIYKKSETDKHTIEDRQNFCGVDWYINENE